MSRGTHRPTWGEDLPRSPDAHLLAEGDSWFTVNTGPIPGMSQNLLHELRFHKATEIINLAQPGDQIRKMTEIARSSRLRQALAPGGRQWDGILLSGGGNDFIDEADEIILPFSERPRNANDPADFCDQAKLQTLVREVQGAFRKIATMRDGPRGPGKGVPILAHTYDYPTPRNAPARFLFRRLGPWLFTALQTSQVPTVHWLPVTDHLFNTLADALLALAQGAGAIPNFHVVDTRNTLQRPDLGVTGRTTDWLNEIHPSDDGYEKLARRIEPVLEPLIGTLP